MQRQEPKDVFEMLRMRFPHLDFQIINPEASFSENLQNIVGQIEMPKTITVKEEITSMKEAVDKQQLKIQKSLVNEDGILVNITNTNHNEVIKKKQTRSIYSIGEQSHSYWEENGQKMEDLMEDIWEFGSSQHNRDWFQQ